MLSGPVMNGPSAGLRALCFTARCIPIEPQRTPTAEGDSKADSIRCLVHPKVLSSIRRKTARSSNTAAKKTFYRLTLCAGDQRENRHHDPVKQSTAEQSVDCEVASPRKITERAEHTGRCASDEQESLSMQTRASTRIWRSKQNSPRVVSHEG